MTLFFPSYNTPSGLNRSNFYIYNHLTPSGSFFNYVKWVLKQQDPRDFSLGSCIFFLSLHIPAPGEIVKRARQGDQQQHTRHDTAKDNE